MHLISPNGHVPADPFDATVMRVLGRQVTDSRPLAGGMTSDVRRIELDDGTVAVAKFSVAPDARLDLEAVMLRHLRDTGAVPVPEVYAANQHVLVMELMPGHHLGPSAEPHAGIFLAALHGVPGEYVGFETDTLNGGLVVPTPPSERWIPFFRDHRLLFAADAAAANGSLPASFRQRIETLASRLDDLLEEPALPTLLHGDVWAANVLAEGSHVTAFLDPALCYGHPELELAYAATFGGFGPPLFDSYEAHRPIAREFWTLRRHVYALYPALLHVYSFGDRFLPLLDSTLSRTGF